MVCALRLGGGCIANGSRDFIAGINRAPSTPLKSQGAAASGVCSLTASWLAPTAASWCPQPSPGGPRSGFTGGSPSRASKQELSAQRFGVPLQINGIQTQPGFRAWSHFRTWPGFRTWPCFRLSLCCCQRAAFLPPAPRCSESPPADAKQKLLSGHLSLLSWSFSTCPPARMCLQPPGRSPSLFLF